MPAGRAGGSAPRKRGPRPPPAPEPLPLDPLRRFVLFLESFAPLVNSLNLGIASPLVLGPPPLQLAQIKTHLALQQLTSAAAAGPAPPHAWVNQALLKSIMFGPRGASPQRPRELNPCGVTPPGSFPAGDAADLQRKPAPRAPQRAPRGLSGQESFQSTLSHRIKVLVTLHRPDPRQVKEKPNLHQEQKAEPRSARWDGGPRVAGAAGPKPPGPARGAEQSSNAQNRYTPESASSILASFGLSNEDLEELSRYPDDQLTPENMPLILREIRIRKMGHSASGARPRSRGEETVGSTSGAAIKSKVIDYGHASKYGYTEDPLEVRAYNPEEPTEDPLEASIYNPEALSRENREDFQREQNMPVVVPPPSVPCNPMFPVEDLIKPAVFQNGSSNPGSFFPAVPARKVPPLCPSPVGLPVVKPVAQPAMPAMPPVLPPILPPILPPLAQPILPPVMPPLVQQSVTQHIISPLPQPPFSAVLITTVSQHEQIPHERIPHEPGPSQPGAQSGLAPGPKPFQPEPEGPIRSPFGIVKASWLPAFLQHGAHKTKRWPTSTMMNDYYATSPRAFPHMCSLCSIECTHMEDWILHQNSTSHIESCRQLRQQYPDWNPESYSSKRNAGDRKENQTPKRCSASASRSPSPRRSRGSGSSSARRRSRSRSRSPGRYWPTRPRCRSPRPMRRPSPRHRSRSPQRSRNPLRTSPRPRRSASNDWAARRSSGSQDRKPSLETVVKTLRPDFVAEITKHKSLQAAGQGPSGSGKPPRSHQPVGKKLLKIRVSSKTSKKVVTPIAGSSSSPPEMADLPQSQEVEEDEEDASTGAGGAHPAADNRLLTEELLSFGTVLQISDLPDDGFTDQDIKNIFQPFGKVSDILVLRSRNEAFLEMNYKEAVIAAVEYGKTVPVVVNGKRVKISVAEKPKESPEPAKTVIKKRTQTPKKVAPSTKKHRAPSTKTTKPLPEAPEAPEVAAAGSAAVEAQAAEPESGSGEDRQTEPVTAAETQHNGAAEPAPAPEKLAPVPEAVLADVGEVNEAVADQEAPRVAVKSEEPPAPAGKEPDDTCVVLISNLPEKGYSVEEIFNLAKPFGGLRDVLILSSHKKAYLEINRKSADSMVKFYTCFAISLDGNQLCISMVPQYKTIKDEEAIFTTLIKDSDPKVNTETIHKQFVHLGNLPDDGYRELEVVCVGLRFGRVDHYVILKNKNKAILQLDSPRSARSMHGFLQQQPYTMGEHTLTCALSPRGHAAQAEVVKKEVKKEEPSEGSSGFKNDPEAPGAVQTAAAHPPAEPSVAKQAPVSSSPSREEASAGQTEPSESRRDGAAREPPPGLAETSTEKVDAGVEVTVTSVKPTAAESSQARSEAMLLPPSSAEKEDHPEPALFEPAVVSASEKDVEEQDEAFSAAALEPAGGLSAAGQGEDVPPVGLAAGEPTGAGPEALPPEPNAPSLETASAVGTQTNKLGAPEKNTISVAVKTEQEISVIPITEKKPVLKTGAAMEKQLDVAGADAAVKAAEPVLTVGRAAEENPEELLVKTEAETEKKLDKSVTKAGTAMENAPNAVSENNEGGLTKAHQSKGTGPAKTDETLKAVTLNSSLSIKDSSCVGKTILKAVVYLPDISKSRCPVWRNQPCLWKGGQQKAPSKPETRSQTTMARKTASKEEAHPRPGGSRCRVSRSCVVAGKGGNGRNSSQQEKECRAGSKLAQEGESRISSVKKDAGSTKVSIAGNTKTAKGGTSSSAKQKEEEKLFPFNLDEFVTVDEVVEETEPPVRPRRNPPRAKRKDAAKPRPNCEPGSKRRKGKSSVGRAAERQPSFVTLDETEEEEEEEEVTARLMAVANLDALSELQGLVVVDEVMEEEEPLLEAVKDPQALVTLDELSDQDELGSQKDVLRSVFEEPDLKAEPLVTVDEIGEVEELPLSEPVGLGVEDALKHKEDEKGDPADGSSQVPDDPSALVTVDEIQEDADNNPLVTLDEVNEDEDDFLADFNRLKEELNFVTVDEVGEEDKEEENPFPGKNLASGEEDEDDVAVAGPEEMGVLQDTRPEVVPANSKSRGKLSGRRAGLREGLIAPELEPRNEITGKERLKQKFTATQKVEDNGGDERSSR